MAESEHENKNWIERNSTTISTLATVSIPVVIAIFGYFANRSLQQDELDQSYVVLAIETLKTELPVNERTECVATVNRLQSAPDGDFGTAAALAGAFQNEVSRSAEPGTDSASAGTDLPQTLFRSYALDLLLASTPATLTVPQYKALLCAETIVPPLTEQPAQAGAEDEKAKASQALVNRLEAGAVEADSACRVRITEGEVIVVGDKSLSTNDDGYAVTRVALEPTAAPTGPEGGSTLPPTNVLYLEVEVESSDADKPTLLWVPSAANVEIQPNRETCTP